MTATATAPRFSRLYIGTQPEPGDRRIIKIDADDAAQVQALPPGPSDHTATIYDHTQNESVTVRRASCGLSCYCALEFAQ